LKTTYKKKCNIYIDVVEKTPGLTKLDRKKLETLIIIEQHHSEVIDKFFLNKQIKRNHFDWLSQLRFTLTEPDAAENLFMVGCEQMTAKFDYGYEYQGNVPRLVITQLTDRAYMTLTSALSMFRGGAP
jgi:dynein heavy chain